jgi:Enoyl-CoA hydratase/carnithine racemase
MPRTTSIGCVAHDMALRLANGPSLGIGSAKMALKLAHNNSLEQQMRPEAYLQRTCCGSMDFIEGCLAFAQKRKPVFTQK